MIDASPADRRAGVCRTAVPAERALAPIRLHPGNPGSMRSSTPAAPPSAVPTFVTTPSLSHRQQRSANLPPWLDSRSFRPAKSC